MFLKNVEVAYFEEKSLNSKFHRNIYYDITLSKFFTLRFQQLRQMIEKIKLSIHSIEVSFLRSNSFSSNKSD